MSRLAPSSLFADLSVRCSPVSGWRGGSIPTFQWGTQPSCPSAHCNSLNDCPESWQDIQQDPALHQMQTELLTLALRGATRSSIHHPTTSLDTMDLACHEGRVPLHWTEPTYTQTPCIFSTPLYLHLIDIIFHGEKKKKNSVVVKIDFRGGKNQFPRW